MDFFEHEKRHIYSFDPSAVKRAMMGANPHLKSLINRLYRMVQIDRRCSVRARIMRAKAEKLAGPRSQWREDPRLTKMMKSMLGKGMFDPDIYRWAR